MIYLDANSDLPPSELALSVYLSEATEQRTLEDGVLRAQTFLDRIARALGADPGTCLETRGGTKADALAIAIALREKPGVVLTSTIEHPAVGESLHQYEKLGWCSVVRVEVDRNGRVDPNEVRARMTSETVLVSIMAASNETGVIQPISDLAELAHGRGIAIHTDAVQCVGRMPVDLQRWGVDYASFSAHKFGGVSSLGVTYVRDTRVAERASQPRETLDEFDLPGLASAVTALERVSVMTPASRDTFEARIGALEGIEVIGASEPRLPNTSLVRFDGCEGDGILMALDLDGIAVSTGSACASGSIEPSPILLAMGFSEQEARETVRFSFGPDVSVTDAETAAESVVRIVERMRS